MHFVLLLFFSSYLHIKFYKKNLVLNFLLNNIIFVFSVFLWKHLKLNSTILHYILFINAGFNFIFFFKKISFSYIKQNKYFFILIFLISINIIIPVLAPLTSFDGIKVQLWLSQYFSNHINSTIQHINTFYPSLYEIFSGFYYYLSPDSFRYIPIYFLILTAVSIFEFVLFITKSDNFAKLAFLSFYSLNFSQKLTVMAKNDFLYVFSGILILRIIFNQERNTKKYIVLGILAGIFLICKYFTLYILTVMIIWHFIFYKKDYFIKNILFFSILLFLLGSYRYIENYILFKNPVFPIKNNLFITKNKIAKYENVFDKSFGQKFSIRNNLSNLFLGTMRKPSLNTFPYIYILIFISLFYYNYLTTDNKKILLLIILLFTGYIFFKWNDRYQLFGHILIILFNFTALNQVYKKIKTDKFIIKYLFPIVIIIPVLTQSIITVPRSLDKLPFLFKFETKNHYLNRKLKNNYSTINEINLFLKTNKINSLGIVAYRKEMAFINVKNKEIFDTHHIEFITNPDIINKYKYVLKDINNNSYFISILGLYDNNKLIKKWKFNNYK